MKNDIVPILLACIDGTLDKMDIQWTKQPSVCVAMASGGYPGNYEKGKIIKGLNDVAEMKDAIVFHAGTAKKDDDIVTAGGRVLGVTALGNSIKDAIDRAYEAVRKISFDGAYYRKDIGHRALDR
jgi:phosphoribosylamine--glycine ligase